MTPACLIPARLVPACAAALLLAWATAATCAAQTPIGYIMQTYAGDQSLGPGESGDAGPANQAQLSGPFNAVPAGGSVYIADQVNHVIRKVTPDGNINLFAGTTGTAGYAGDGNTALNAYFNLPLGVAVDSAGNVYIADSANNAIRKVDTKGNVSSIAGNTGSAGYGGDGGPAISGYLNQPNALVLDAAGNIYIADTGNNRIRKVSTSGTITLVAGNNFPAYAGDGGPAVVGELNHPEGLAVDGAGNVYVADTFNHVIRKVSNGIITTFAGTGGVAGFSGDGGAANKAKLNHPEGVAVDAGGNVYIADSFNNRIRRVGANGVITTIAGTGLASYGGDGLLATDSAMRFPSGVSVDSAGKIYVADPQNNVIRVMNPIPGGPPAISANGVITASAFGGFSTAAPGSWIEIYGSNLAANTRGWLNSDFTNILAPTTLDGTSVTVGGQPAFVSYISGNQLNVQVPNVGTGPQPVIVNTPAGATPPYTITINTNQPGLLAPAVFSSGGKPYVGALFADGVTFAGPPGAFPGVTSKRAKPGDTLTLYGVGFGAVNDPAAAPGKIELTDNTVTAPLQILFGQAQAQVSFSGLAPLAVGLYQFNLVVPNVAANDAVPVTFTLGGTPGAQTLYTAIGN
jgi:uncharacterized protein (TIGR03437 family)